MASKLAGSWRSRLNGSALPLPRTAADSIDPSLSLPMLLALPLPLRFDETGSSSSSLSVTLALEIILLYRHAVADHSPKSVEAQYWDFASFATYLLELKYDVEMVSNVGVRRAHKFEVTELMPLRDAWEGTNKPALIRLYQHNLQGEGLELQTLIKRRLIGLVGPKLAAVSNDDHVVVVIFYFNQLRLL
ncbi:hypothetical protein LTR37_004446 [Vermiconidia calcicola]|uniref:Uncharacterized protein n=1 Tax=Vermiconidia calcicola TaxID=1690605 RepID=A0ACC3NLP5_9PEZI|nr:hypothetical protein LTR37_004446 [Vermiconidia calcicola]